MASPPLVLPGVLFVGEDERARVVAQLGPAAGWLVPQGIGGWSHEVALVTRESLTEEIRRSTKLVMPDEQIPQAKMPLTREAALKAPLVAVSSKLVPKLLESGVRVHTVGVDRVTSSFYYIAEGGDEEPVKVEGDMVAAVGAMLGDRAETSAIERVLDGLTDRLLRGLSRDRLTELSVELAAALPRAAADGSGSQGIDLEAFERSLAALIAGSEKYAKQAREIADNIAGTYERRLTVPLYGDARKSSMGPFDITVGDKKVSLPTYERWVMSGPLNPAAAASAAAAAPAKASSPPPPAKAEPAPVKKAEEPKPAPVKTEAAPVKKAEEPKPAPVKTEAAPEKKPEEPKPAPVKAEAAPEKKPEEPKPAPAKAEAAPEKKPEEPKPAPAKTEAAPEKKPEPKPEPEKARPAAEPKPAAAAKPKPEAAKAPAPIAKKEDRSSAMTWIALVLLAAAGFLAWRLWLSH